MCGAALYHLQMHLDYPFAGSRMLRDFSNREVRSPSALQSHVHVTTPDEA